MLGSMTRVTHWVESGIGTVTRAPGSILMFLIMNFPCLKYGVIGVGLNVFLAGRSCGLILIMWISDLICQRTSDSIVVLSELSLMNLGDIGQ